MSDNKTLTLTFKVNSPTTLDAFLKERHFGYQMIYQEIKQGNILVNSKVITSRNHPLAIDDLVMVILNDEVNELYENNAPIDIVYEDEYFLIVNKPYGIDVEPSRYSTTNNLASMITHYFNEHNIKSKIHLVNRLDKLTTGLVIVAKNRYIKNLFKYVDITKRYYCLVEGTTKEHEIIINKMSKDIQTGMRVEDENGKQCKTEYTRIKVDNNNSLLDVRIYTGRTHQIRSTFKYIGHPLVNDPLYNKENVNGDMFLKAYLLEFIHPITEQKVSVKI